MSDYSMKKLNLTPLTDIIRWWASGRLPEDCQNVFGWQPERNLYLHLYQPWQPIHYRYLEACIWSCRYVGLSGLSIMAYNDSGLCQASRPWLTFPRTSQWKIRNGPLWEQWLMMERGSSFSLIMALTLPKWSSSCQNLRW